MRRLSTIASAPQCRVGRLMNSPMAGERFLAMAQVEHEAGDDCGKADHGGDGWDDQCSCRKPVVLTLVKEPIRSATEVGIEKTNRMGSSGSCGTTPVQWQVADPNSFQ